jgi:hypothetical protein
MNTPASISNDVSQRLATKKNGAEAVTVADAQSMGFDCGSTLDSCHFSGDVKYRFLNVPAGNDVPKVGTKHIRIKIAQENPLLVQTDVDDIPE